jgi:hypothetical protein
MRVVKQHLWPKELLPVALEASATLSKRCSGHCSDRWCKRALGDPGRCPHLRPLACLEAAVGVDPQQLAVAAQQVHVQEGLDLALNKLHPASNMRNKSASISLGMQVLSPSYV